MQVILKNDEILIERLIRWIQQMQYILDNRRDLYWTRCEMKKGRVITNPLSVVKKRFKEWFIDRAQKVLEAISNGIEQEIDWIEHRDILDWVCFEIDMQGEKSYKDLRESKKDITIQCRDNYEAFEGMIEVHRRFI